MAEEDRWTGAVTLFIEEQGCSGRAMDVDMPVEVWSNLPKDILLQVLTRLPIRNFMRFKAVCRSWRAMLSKPGVFRPPRCLCSIQEPAATLGAIRLPQQLRLQGHRVQLPRPPVKGLLFQCSYRGLLYFMVNVIPKHRWMATVYICNPLSKSWRKLAPLDLSCGGWLDRLLVQEDAVTAVSSKERLYVHKGGGWQKMDWEPPGLCRGLLHVVAEGVIYTLSEGTVHRLSVSRGGREDDLHIAEPCNLKLEHWEVEHDGCFFLVGKMWTEFPESPVACFGIWKLDTEAVEWEHVTSVPDEHYQGMLLHFDGPALFLVWARSVLGYILLCVRSGDVDSHILLGYHTQEQTWHVVSTDPDQVSMLNKVFPFKPDGILWQ